MRVLALLLLLWISAAATASPPPLETLGIPPQDEAYYRGGVIKCRDGSGKFTRDQLNDDFCDCPDGTDEPGTSACPEAKFYCKNAGHSPITIFSSRVNDGICDCCDGSDEYGSNSTCKNTCWEAGKAAREKLKKKVATYKSGVVIRNQEVEKAKLAIAKDEAELTKLKGEEKILQGLVDKLKEQKRLIEKAEEEERLIKEKEEKRIKEEAEKQAAEENKAPDASQEADSQDTNEKAQEDESKVVEHHDGDITDHDNHSPEGETSVEVPDIKAGTGDDEPPVETSAVPTEEQDPTSVNSEGLSKAELGRLVASRWTGENVDDVGKSDKKGHEDELDIPEPAEEAFEDEHDIPEPVEENYAGYHSEVEDDRHKFEDEELSNVSDDEYVDDHEEPDVSYKSDDDRKGDDHSVDLFLPSDLTASGQASWLDKIQQTVQNVLQKFNFFKTPVDLSEAAHVRKEYDDASSKLSKIQSRITSLTDKLKQDFGKEKEFYYFYDQCFEGKEGKYVYKVCPYKKASQVEGHSSTNLGRWDKFEESYRMMRFSNGDKCWNGPDRSLKVRLRCGLSNKLNGVDEPSRCEYVAVLSTPAMCVEEKLKELQQKLDAASSNLSSHDEL
ncbi:unnamed protein product [Triticum turgidum subsp. durum]|uniref:Glucosidase 2 subunit beta n=1 Tax=Triticum turgidum subsp. durum TaxID=4567 RepID=A0A9R1QF19_TRITD|nr:unnamed protein product [Triticum turgidum subsp. durum]